MSSPAATYDLMLLLDPQAEEQRRAKLVSDASSAISKQGELVRHDTWGERPLAYHIDRKTSAEYHLMQFHASSPELLGALDRSLRIADEVLRFRLIKLEPGVPEAPDMKPGAAPPRRAADGAEGRGRVGAAGAPERAAADEQPAAPESATAEAAGGEQAEGQPAEGQPAEATAEPVAEQAEAQADESGESPADA